MPQDYHILAVDDDPINLEIIEHSLRKSGYQVTTSSNGSKALLALNTSPHDFHLILLDRMMPVMDGIETLKQIRSSTELSSIPVIMQTAASSKEQVIEGLKAGALFYLTKPYSKKSLLTAVSNALEGYQQSLKKKQSLLNEGIQIKANYFFTIQSEDELKNTLLFLTSLLDARHPSDNYWVLSLIALICFDETEQEDKERSIAAALFEGKVNEAVAYLAEGPLHYFTFDFVIHETCYEIDITGNINIASFNKITAMTPEALKQCDIHEKIDGIIIFRHFEPK